METFSFWGASSLYGGSSWWRLFVFTMLLPFTGTLLYGDFSSLRGLFLFTGALLYGDFSSLRGFFSLQGLFFIETFLFTGLLLFTGFLLFTGTLLYGDFSSRGGTLLFGHVSVPCKSEGQVKLGLLLKRPSFTRTFGLPRFDRAPLSFPSRSSSPSFFLIGPHCLHIFMVSEPQMTTDNYIGSMLNLTWTPFETADAWLESTIFFDHLQITASNGLFKFTIKSH